MSAIGSVGSSALSLVQSAARQRIDRDGDEGFAAQMKSRFEAAAKSAGVDPSKIPDLEQQIQDAIQKARGGAGGPSRGAVQDAINSVLKSNGVDPAKFQAALKSQGAGRAHHHHRAQGTGKSQQASPSDPTADPLVQSLQAQVTGTGNIVDVAA